MPRCFMAKKLKYPYEQWKQQQQSSRSPSPVDDDDDQPIDATVKKPRYDEEEETRLQVRSEAAPTFTPPTAHLLAAHYNFLSGFQRPSPAHHASSSALTPPPESSKKDIFRPYCLDDRQIKSERPTFEDYYPFPPSYLQYRNIEDINTAHAILDLSAPHRNSSSSSSRSSTPPPSQQAKLVTSSSHVTPTPLLSPALSNNGDVKVEPNPAGTVFKINGGKTTAYTYEAFFASDGRSRKKNVPAAPATPATPVPVPDNGKPRYTCTECGKNYATSSNLSRHKQTHRSLDSNNAKKCHVCGKMYVSMPALSMHILTHNLSHKCDVCGKAFSRPWLLQGHMRSHSGDKPYGCAHCGKSFADRSNLRAHMQTHSAFKNFKCKRCNKSFALKSYLNKHYESACFKDQPIPHIDTPPVTPAPSEQSDSSGLASPSSVHSGEHYSPSINTLLSVLPPSIHAPTPIIPHGQQHLLRV